MFAIVVGTPAFMAPEIIENPLIGFKPDKVDVFAYAVILFLFLFEFLPWGEN